MKVKYIVRDIKEKFNSEMSDNERSYFQKWSLPPDNISLTYKKEYVVLGIVYSNEGNINLMLADDTDVSYPSFYPIDFFEVTDNRLSKYWSVVAGKHFPIDKTKKNPSFITFREATEKLFFDRLIDGDKKTQKLFFKYKNLIENEFPETDLKAADILDEQWVMCHACDESWKVKTDSGIIFCPKNKHRNNNPFWKESTIKEEK